MARVQRPPIEADIWAETVRLSEPLRGVVAMLAQALERTEPEFVDVAVMWLDVVADFCCGDDTALETERAQRVFAQLVPPDSSPSVPWSTNGASAAEMTPAKAADVSANERHASLDERKTEQIKAIQANSFPIVRLRCRSTLRAM